MYTYLVFISQNIKTAFCIGILCTSVSSNEGMMTSCTIVCSEKENLFQITYFIPLHCLAIANVSLGIFLSPHKYVVRKKELTHFVSALSVVYSCICFVNIIDFFMVKNWLKLKK